ncbi:MAG: BTAD domain-containing putative transcriptional regulator [Acidimicrobiia bacterium]
MEFGILGPLEIRDGDQTVTISGIKERAILGLLIVEAGTVVSADRMVFELWGDTPPRTATKSLRSHVSRLRRSLGGTTTIVTQRPGYRLALDGHIIDAARFESLADDASRLASDPIRRWQTAREALALWRGPALADLSAFAFADGEARRLEERRIRTAEHAMDAGLRIGRHRDLIPELRVLTTEHPYHEAYWAQLMLALYRSGRAGDALDVFREASTVLGEGLGIGPSVELRELERSVVLQDETLNLRVPTGPHNLPASVSSFVGRERELASLARSLGDSRLVTMTGAGGSGKSRLAREQASRSLMDYADGVWIVELSSLIDPDDIPAAVCIAMGEPASHATDPTDALVSLAGTRRMLLLLDNCEHMVDAVGMLVGRILSECPNTTILATSRVALRVPGETIWLVPPLQLPDLDDELEVQVATEAVRLFVVRAREAAHEVSFEGDDMRTISALCIALGGLPLAVELAASRIGAFGLADLAERLEGGLSMLGAGRTELAHHRSMKAAIGWSVDLLTGDERRAFVGLAVFLGGWTLADAEAVLGGRIVPLDEVAGIVASLVDQSLVEVHREHGVRYRFLEPIREFAREQLHASEMAADLDLVHALRFLEVCGRADEGLRGREQTDWLARLRADHDNIRKALRWSVDAKRGDIALGLVASCAWFWFMAGHWREVSLWLDAALDAAGDDHPLLRARAIARADGIQVIRVNVQPAATRIEAAEAVCRAEGDRYYEAWCVHLRGHAHIYDEAGDPRRPIETAREIFVELDRPWEVAWSDRYLGDAFGLAGMSDDAIEVQLLSISAFREMGDLWSTAYGLHNLANFFLVNNAYGPSVARPYFERCMRIAQDIGDPVWHAHGLNGLAHCDFQEEAGDPTTRYLEAADRLRRIGDDACLASAVGFLGDLSERSGEIGPAAGWYAEAIRIAERLSRWSHIGANFDRLARLAHVTNRSAQARRLVAAVDGGLGRGEMRFTDWYAATHREVARSVGIEGPTTEPIADLIPFALELAETIADGA